MLSKVPAPNQPCIYSPTTVTDPPRPPTSSSRPDRCQVLIAASLSLANADIVVSRTINSLSAGTINATLDSGCTGSDTYGSNNCDLDWGDANSHAITAK